MLMKQPSHIVNCMFHTRDLPTLTGKWRLPSFADRLSGFHGGLQPKQISHLQVNRARSTAKAFHGRTKPSRADIQLYQVLLSVLERLSAPPAALPVGVPVFVAD